MKRFKLILVLSVFFFISMQMNVDYDGNVKANNEDCNINICSNYEVKINKYKDIKVPVYSSSSKKLFQGNDYSVKYKLISGEKIVSIDKEYGYFSVYGKRAGVAKLEIYVEYDYYEHYDGCGHKEDDCEDDYNEDENYNEEVDDEESGDCHKKGSVRKVITIKVHSKGVKLSQYYMRTRIFGLSKVKGEKALYLNVNNITEKNIIMNLKDISVWQAWSKDYLSVLGCIYTVRGRDNYKTSIKEKIVIKPGEKKKIKVKIKNKNIDLRYAVKLKFKCKWKGKNYKITTAK